MRSASRDRVCAVRAKGERRPFLFHDEAAGSFFRRLAWAPDGSTAIEQISHVYGAQAVVVSIDPRRVRVARGSPEEADALAKGFTLLPAGGGADALCWYQATVKGGREGRELDALQLARACEALGAGEIMLNCIDMDGQCAGYDHALIGAVSDAVSIPVIASSGAGAPVHFGDVFEACPRIQAALAAGIFHRGEVAISAVKEHLESRKIPARLGA